MRIVAGKHRGRKLLPLPAGKGVRPTSDRIRESLFDILAHGETPLPDGATVLDAFAGSGALGLEALSRGAAQVTFLEQDKGAADLIRDNLETLGEADRGVILRRDATRPGPAMGPAADLAFLDPPYGAGLGPTALKALAEGGWLATGAIIVLETAAREGVELPEGFTLLDERSYAATCLLFLTYEI